MFNSCEIDTALAMCEQEDAAMKSLGITWETNYIGIAANATGANSLQALFAYDASIGFSQDIELKAAVNDPVNVLTGNSLITNFDNSLANTCPATNNEQIVACIARVAQSVPNFHYMWDLYDEPGCPNQSISFCGGTQAGGNYANELTLATYIHSIDPTHIITGVQVGDCCGNPNGGSQQSVINTLFSWISTAPESGTGFDYYPIPEGATFGQIANIGTDATDIAAEIQANNPGMQMNVTLQAFSWYQEGGKGCTSMTVCPYPTESQMQEERDEAVYYAAQAHQPISVIFWYYWPDITCNGATENYPGCSASANEAALESAINAPFPASAPSPSLRKRHLPKKR